MTQPASLTPYVYALNNPVLLSDPSGENPLLLVGGLGGLLGGAIYGYGSQVVRNLNQGMCFWDALSTGIDAGQVALYAGVGTVLGLGMGGAMVGIQALAGYLTAGGTVGTFASQTVYRGLSAGDNPANGLWARTVNAGNSAISHVAGKVNSQWISTSKNLSLTIEEWGKNGVVEIDLSKVSSEIVDFSRGIPGMENTMISNWAQKYQEVLIKNYIPPEAIISIIFEGK